VEQGERVFFIDKHAAHERMNFDKLKARDYQPMSQLLLTPLTLNPPPEEGAALLAHSELLQRFGFELEDFGGGALLVRQVPDYLSEGEVENTLSELAQRLLTTGTADPSAARDEVLHTMACKSAIKGGWKNDRRELEAVARAVMSGQVRYCPHGRPVAVELTRKQLEKQFKRT
jgi:DNA mismatch repair protein MutL